MSEWESELIRQFQQRVADLREPRILANGVTMRLDTERRTLLMIEGSGVHLVLDRNEATRLYDLLTLWMEAEDARDLTRRDDITRRELPATP